ncbi:glycosyltransferase family 4 protein [Spirosoma rigui]|uniref:glycosyltransferase family 4 protein n=1 Tax=Spirosoma rigui TaxID=564064 RepID=UPI0009B1812B|nr:glycosyltransferase family 4 protein [Spirosoma rigui]
MNVLITTSLASTSPSGVVTYYTALARDLADKGIGVTVIEAGDTPRLWRTVLNVLKRLMRPIGGAFYVLYDEFAYFTGLYLAARKLRREPFTLIHAQDVRSGVAAYLALRRRLPVVLTCHFNDDPVTELTAAFTLSNWFRNRLSAWYRFLFSMVTNYVFVSNYAYRKSMHLLPLVMRKRILYNTVNIEDTAPPAPSDVLRISNVGYIDERKNQRLLIDIAQELHRRSVRNFSIWLIGDGPKRAEYEQLVNQLHLSDRVKFYGRQESPWKLVAQTDLYIHTALNDNCPYSIVEAFAVKTPVLALPVGGVPELVSEAYGQLHGTDVSSLTSEVLSYFDESKRATLAHEQSIVSTTRLNHHRSLSELISFYKQAAQCL